MNDKQRDRTVNLNANPARGEKTTVEDAISRRLRDFYDSVAEEPIPDRFIDLLEKLDQAEQQSKTDRGETDDDA